jgi:hypothetical protein
MHETPKSLLGYPQPKPVKNIVTGEIYPTLTAASKALGISVNHIKRKIREGDKLCWN